MSTIEELKNNIRKYEKIEVKRNFKSKKNQVAYVFFNKKDMVLKLYSSSNISSLKKEVNILQKTHLDLNTPRIIDVDYENNLIFLNYINGENVCDIINNDDVDYFLKNKIVLLVGQWYIDFHNLFKKKDACFIHGDSNLRNFIFKDDKIYGLDFEESCYGDPKKDYADICCSILTTNPIFTFEKYSLCSSLIRFIETCLRNKLDFFEELRNSLFYAFSRRDINFSMDEASEVIDNLILMLRH